MLTHCAKLVEELASRVQLCEVVCTSSAGGEMSFANLRIASGSAKVAA